ncbi:MAG: hypothetical protein NW226_16650, partial [Microscillaceae bacterium]|nr:hypothetical protein [Microscillaceae bacterium]
MMEKLIEELVNLVNKKEKLLQNLFVIKFWELEMQQRLAEIGISIKDFDLPFEELPEFESSQQLFHEELSKAQTEILRIETQIFIVDL